MNSFPRVLRVVAAGIFLAGGLLILWLWNRARDLRAYETQVHAEFVGNGALMTALHNRRSAAGKVGLATANAQLNASAASPKPTAAANVTSGVTNMDRGRQTREALLRMPEYAPFLRADLRRRTMREYGEWFAQLDVSPEHLESIKQLVAGSIGTKQDAFEAATAAGYRMSTLEFAKVMRNYREEAETRLRQGFTPEEYVSYRNFETAKAWTNTELPQLEAYLGERGVSALTPQQKRVLREAYVAALNWEPTGDKPALAVLYRMRNEQIGILAGHALESVQREALVGYLTFINTRSQIMGQLLNPKDPDGVIIVPGVAPR
ncbi:MAG: hypothetical protein Q7S40_26670 [Opitutaceae bacterium]|nr:hypothetical protein [Opitutaceae bacterium]